MKKVSKVIKPTSSQVKRNKRICKVVTRVLTIMISVGITTYTFTIPVRAKTQSDNNKFHYEQTTEEKFNHGSEPFYNKTAFDELMNQINNQKPKELKKRLFKQSFFYVTIIQQVDMDNIDVKNVTNDELLELKKTIEDYLSFLNTKIQENSEEEGEEDE